MIPLAIPNVSGNERRNLQRCIDENQVSSVGSFVVDFEQGVAAAAGAKGGVATSSGTTALHLGLTVLGVRAGELVIIPSFTFIATANAVAHCGATPWLFDVAADSWTLDTLKLRTTLAAETERTGAGLVHKKSGRRIAALLPVYTLGVPSDMDVIGEIAGEYRIPVLADAASALGARYRGRNLGGLASLTAFSFNGNKTITCGGGGMLVGDDVELLERARHLSTTARVGAEYNHDQVGFNYRMTNLQAAVGCAQLERLSAFVERKRDIAAAYREGLGDLPGVGFFPEPEWAKSACWLSGICFDSSGVPDIGHVRDTLRNRSIEARSFWKPVHLQAPFASAPRTSQSCAEGVWQRILALPCSTGLTAAMQDQVLAAVRESLR